MTDRRQYQAEYKRANREKLRDYEKARRARKKARTLQLSRAQQSAPEAKATKRAWYLKNRERILADRVHSKFALTPEQVAKLRAAQGEACAICGDKLGTGQASAIDHCHASGRVRGVLCAHCNRGLGCFRDRPELLKSAAAYLVVRATVSE